MLRLGGVVLRRISLSIPLLVLSFSPLPAQWLETTIPVPDSLVGLDVPTCAAWDPVSDRVYVGGAGPYVHVLDPATHTKLLRIPVHLDTRVISCDTTHRHVYCAHASADAVSVIDAASSRVLLTLAVGDYPTDMYLDHARGQLYVANRRGGDITIVDCATIRPVGLIRVGGAPAILAADPSARRLYCLQTDAPASIVAVDLNADSVLTEYVVGGSPEALCISPRTGKLYCADAEHDVVLMLTPNSDTLVPIPVGAQPVALCCDPDSSTVFCADFNSATISVIDGAADSVVATIPSGGGPNALAFDPTIRRVYCSAYWSDEVTVVDPSGDSVIGHVPVGDAPERVFPVPGHGTAYSFNSGSNDLTAIDGLTATRVACITTRGRRPIAACCDGQRGKVYFGYDDWNALSVLDARTLTVSSHIPLDHPAVLLICNEMLGKLYCANEHYLGSITVVDTDADTVIRTINAGRHPSAMAISQFSAFRLYCSNSGEDDVLVVDGYTDSVVGSVLTDLGPTDLAWHWATDRGGQRHRDQLRSRFRHRNNRSRRRTGRPGSQQRDRNRLLRQQRGHDHHRNRCRGVHRGCSDRARKQTRPARLQRPHQPPVQRLHNGRQLHRHRLRDPHCGPGEGPGARTISHPLRLALQQGLLPEPGGPHGIDHRRL
jgi:YVTN family beta-propeller protein